MDKDISKDKYLVWLESRLSLIKDKITDEDFKKILIDMHDDYMKNYVDLCDCVAVDSKHYDIDNFVIEDDGRFRILCEGKYNNFSLSSEEYSRLCKFIINNAVGKFIGMC